MTIQERNEIAMAFSPLIHKIISMNFKDYDHDDLFQIGFLAVLKSISAWNKGIIILNDPCFRAFVAAYIHNNIRWYLLDEYRNTYFDSDKVIDVTEQDLLENKIDFEKMRMKLDALLRHSLSYTQINILKIYFGFDGPARSLKDMAEIMHCSREYVRQQIKSALRKLRHGYSNIQKRILKNDLLKELKNYER